MLILLSHLIATTAIAWKGDEDMLESSMCLFRLHNRNYIVWTIYICWGWIINNLLRIKSSLNDSIDRFAYTRRRVVFCSFCSFHTNNVFFGGDIIWHRLGCSRNIFVFSHVISHIQRIFNQDQINDIWKILN